jgi:acetyl esterase/lipase
VSTRSVLSRAARWPDAVVRYAEHEDGLIDLHLPASPSASLPVIVVIHGGFWRDEWDRRHTRAMAVDLASRGYVVATPEYRRTGGRGGWPMTLDDVRDAVNLLPSLLASLDIPVGPLHVLGHSAGGHLALWLATVATPATRFVGLAPVAALADAFALDLDGGAVEALLGGSPFDVPARYDEADPARRLSLAAPHAVRIVHGTADDLVPISLSRSVAASFPDRVTLTELEGADHFALIDPDSPAWQTVLTALLQ